MLYLMCGAIAYLQQVLDQTQSHDTVATAHATQVVALNVTSQLELVDKHGSKTGGWAIDAAVCDKDVNLLSPDAWSVARK